MQNRNINFKNRIGGSNRNFANRPRCASAHCEQAAFCKGDACANRTRRSLDKSLYGKIGSWSAAILVVFGLFAYLIFIPEQAFAAYDWETRKLSDITTMQEMNAKICENTTEIGVQYKLEDTRDHKVYYVAKLADNNCWMTQNLAYDGGGTEQCDLGDGISCPGWPDAISRDGMARYAKGTHVDGDHSSQGNFYSWEAAMNNNTSASEPTQGICPYGWQLPTSNNTNSKSFGSLTGAYSINDNAAGSIKLNSEPLYFQYSGNIGGSRLYDAGSSGWYWSSTPSSGSIAYYLRFNGSNVTPSRSSGRYGGFSLRCVNAEIYPEKPPVTDTTTSNIAITVSPVISIDVTKHADDMTVDFTQVAKSSIIARVGSNQGYQVLISTEQSNLEQSPIVENQHIPMITTDQEISAGNKAWGISKDITVVSSTGTTISNPTIDTNTIYSPIGLGENKALFYTSNTPASEDLTFPVAIAVDSTLPSGQYSTQVTLTAVAM